MAKEVKNKISLDASRFERGTKAVRRNISTLERGLTVDLKRAVNLGKTAIIGMGVAVAGIGTALAVGIRSVVNLGADMDHLATQTGATVSQLMVLRQTFKDNGVSSDNARLAINKMQKSIVEAKQGIGEGVRAFDALGLSAEELSSMSPDEQFRAIGQAITDLEDPAERAAAAMGVFGRAGAEMQSVFGEGKLEDAAQSIGAQAEILEKNSRLFERVGTLLDRTGNKLQGFFVGIADKVVPIILPLLERFDKMDLARQGQRFGEAIATGLRAVIGLFENNRLGEMAEISMQEAGLNFINTIARGWIGLGRGLWGMMREGLTGFIPVMRNAFVGIAQVFSAFLLDAVGTGLSKIPGAGGAGRDLQDASVAVRGDAIKSFANMRGDFSAMLDGMAAAFADGMADAADTNIFDTTDLANRREQLLREAIASVPAIGEAAAKLLEDSVSEFAPTDDGDDITGRAKALTGGVSGLASIGGGGGVGATGMDAMINEGRQQTGLLRQAVRQLETVNQNISNNGFTPDLTLRLA